MATTLYPGGVHETAPFRYYDLGPMADRGTKARARFALKTLDTFYHLRGKVDILHTISSTIALKSLALTAGALVGVPVVYSLTSRGEKVTGIPPFVDLSRFGPTNEHEGLRVGFLGAPDERKGIWVFEKMMDKVRFMFPAVRFWVSFPAYTKQLPHLLAAALVFTTLQFSENVTVSYDVDVLAFLSSLDVLVFPNQEARHIMVPPVTVLEGMAAGCCVVATDLAQTGRLIQNRENGLLVPISQKADPSAFAAYVVELLASPGWRARMGARARESASQYDVHVAALKVEQIYRRAKWGM